MLEASLKVTNGEGNIVDRSITKFASGEIQFSPGSRGNVVHLGVGMQLNNVKIQIIGNDNRVIFGKNSIMTGSIYVKGGGQVVSVGDYTTTAGLKIMCEEGCNVEIGRHCMISREIEVRTSDAHSVVDVITHKRLNQAKSVFIGDHVWIGMRCLFTKGASVGSDCVVGANSLVNKKIDGSGLVIAGVPASVLRRGITWNRAQSDEFSEEDLFKWKTF